MKKTILTTLTAAAILGLSGCADNGAYMDPNFSASGAEMANMNDMQRMQRDCKNYLAEKYKDLPMAAFSVRPGYSQGEGRYSLPVSINWDEPRVEETGNCIIENGIVRNYKANY